MSNKNKIKWETKYQLCTGVSLNENCHIASVKGRDYFTVEPGYFDRTTKTQYYRCARNVGGSTFELIDRDEFTDIEKAKAFCEESFDYYFPR